MTNQEWLAKQIKDSTAEQTYEALVRLSVHLLDRRKTDIIEWLNTEVTRSD